MNTLLSLLLILAPLATPAQEPAGQPDGPLLEVLDADVKAYPPPRIVNGPPSPGPPPGPMSVDDIPGRSSTSQQSNRASSPSRAAELNRVDERRARRTASGTRAVTTPSTSSWYEYRLRVRNAGSKKVKSLFWEYRVVDPHVTAATRRLFQCTEQVKPGESKRLRAFTPMAPVTVVSAEGAGDTPKAEAVINRVEYTDGSAWQRAGWEPGETKGNNSGGADRGKRKLRGECSAL